jgi:hypothetical protein
MRTGRPPTRWRWCFPKTTEPPHGSRTRREGQAAAGTSKGGSQYPWSPRPLTKLERQPWRPWGSCSSREAEVSRSESAPV